jgi:hypothetical protein
LKCLYARLVATGGNRGNVARDRRIGRPMCRENAEECQVNPELIAATRMAYDVVPYVKYSKYGNKYHVT